MEVYANRKCKTCLGSGFTEYLDDTVEVHGFMTDVWFPCYCGCVTERLRNVQFRYYDLPIVERDDDIPF